MNTLKAIQYFRGVKILVRVDFNVPIKNGFVSDDFRIKTALPTINLLSAHGAKVIMISHLETNDGSNPSLEPIANHLNKIGRPVTFISNLKEAPRLIDNLKDGGCILLENIRFFDGEKTNDKNFSKELASLADIYVNEAFSACHREHASIVGVPKLLPSYAGLQLEKEVAALSKAFSPSHPFLFILGGAKFDTKLPLVQKFIRSADNIFIGGALANDFFKAKGYEIGVSLISKGDLDLKPLLKEKKILIPTDVIDQNHKNREANALTKADKIMDAGSASVEALKKIILKAKFILWNGPLGLYEDGYQGATLELAKAISEATGKGAETIIGGGDTLAAVSAQGLNEHFSFISTGGGAMLDFLAKGTLPGIDALNDAAKREQE